MERSYPCITSQKKFEKIALSPRNCIFMLKGSIVCVFNFLCVPYHYLSPFNTAINVDVFISDPILDISGVTVTVFIFTPRAACHSETEGSV